ncbi:MAG: gliding motility lipoprotein GldD [Bacteroidota bacterium]|jgi:gliding motility-associated lipoprotein GldD|nr:gliding motility lipoprotein GldD [Bacteroidota bacterium]
MKINDFKFRISNFKLSRGLSFLPIVYCLFLFSSCVDDDDSTIAPKPRAYYRISFPEKKYVEYDSTCPFKFQIPVYAKITRDEHSSSEPCWLNLEFPKLNATLHLSYKEVTNNLNSLMEDTYTLASKHQIKASGIEEQLVSKDSTKVYGLLYEIGGNAASSIQFFLTDSTKHFLRGALYFNSVPNTDSIKPALEFVREDIYKMIESFEWKGESPMPSSKAVK